MNLTKVNVSMIAQLKLTINIFLMGNINVQIVQINIIMGKYVIMNVLLNIIILLKLMMELQLVKILHLNNVQINVLQVIMNQKIKHVIL